MKKELENNRITIYEGIDGTSKVEVRLAVELKKNSVVAFFATTAADGRVDEVEYFSLDAILSVGYSMEF